MMPRLVLNKTMATDILTMQRRTFYRKAHSILKILVSVCVIFVIGFWESGGQLKLEASPSQDIRIQSQPPFFSPNQLTISLGTPLTWENRSHEPHTIVSDDCRSRNICSFDSGFLGPNAHFTLPPLKPGLYPYHCGIHPFMRGLLTIHPPQSFSSSDI